MLASDIFRVVFGLAAVIGMIGAAAFVARKAGLSALTGVVAGKRRLAISEALPLDARRRLAILRCDDLEYLVILGPNGETLLGGEMKCPAAIAGAEVAQANPFSDLGVFAQKLRSAGAGLTKTGLTITGQAKTDPATKDAA
jgi:flagellar protein FliO/FliZ